MRRVPVGLGPQVNQVERSETHVHDDDAVSGREIDALATDALRRIRLRALTTVSTPRERPN